MKNMFRQICSVAGVWIVTIAANIWAQFLDVLPMIRDIAGTLSALAAIGFSFYMLKKNWAGWLPKGKKNGTG